MTPGVSRNAILDPKFIFCTPLVCPLVMLVGATFLPFNAFISDDFPTFGYPKTPTLILSLLSILFASINLRLRTNKSMSASLIAFFSHRLKIHKRDKKRRDRRENKSSWKKTDLR